MRIDIQPGLRLHDTDPSLSFEERLQKARAQGFTCVQLALSKIPELTADPAALTPGYAALIRKALREADLDLSVLGCYLNLGNHDSAAMQDIQTRYIAHLRFAAFLGMGVIGTETGWPGSAGKPDKEACRSEIALEHFLLHLRPIVKTAEKFGVFLAIEPVISHIVWNAKRARVVLDSINSVCQSAGYSSIRMERGLVAGDTGGLDNYGSAKDITMMVRDLYTGKFSSIGPEFMREYFHISEGDSLPTLIGTAQNLSEGAVVLNQNGHGSTRYNETAIVLDDGAEYIMTVMLYGNAELLYNSAVTAISDYVSSVMK